MADSFGGSLNMVLWILIIVGGGYYSYRCLFATKGFVDQYGFGDSAVFMTRFAGTCVGASTLVALVLLFVVRKAHGLLWRLLGRKRCSQRILAIQR